MGSLSNKAIGLASCVCLLALAACSSGGGSGAAPNTTASNNSASSSGNNSSGSSSSSSSASNSSSSNSSSAPTPPACSTNVCISAPGTPSFGGATPITENGNTPNFSNSLPAAGTSFPLMITGWKVTQTSVSDASITSGTLTFQGVTSGKQTFELKIPSINLDAPNLTGGTTATLSDGSTAGIANIAMGALNYASMGVWRYFDKSGINGWQGALLTGYQTQTGHVPTSGSATFIGQRGTAQGDAKAGGVEGAIWVPSGGGPAMSGSGLSGNATLNINFATGSVDGQLTNMTVGTGGGTTVPWNNVSLTGSLSGASLSGTTSTSGPPAGSGFFPQGMSSAATGTFKGAFYGPTANEVGAIWSLSESTVDGGKSAIGVIAATHQ